MRITSPAFRNEEPIPRQYTRDGEDKNPPLNIADVPANTKSLVLILDDPDAPRGTFAHWILFDLDPTIEDITEDHAPNNATQGVNDWDQAEYGGPKPPWGEHRYFFRLYALDKKIDLPRGSTRREIENAMRDHVIDSAELMGRYAATASAGVRCEA